MIQDPVDLLCCQGRLLAPVQHTVYWDFQGFFSKAQPQYMLPQLVPPEVQPILSEFKLMSLLLLSPGLLTAP